MNRFLAAIPFLILGGCLSSTDQDVVVYTALDQDYSKPIFEEFERQTDYRVRAKYDAESTKTLGLVNSIIDERDRPRCHVFWNNELLHTLRLKKLGLLDVYHSPQAKHFPAGFQSAEGDWYGLAARARVLIVNTELVPEDKRPTRIEDLVDPQWQGKVGVAKPLFGTTATHFAVLYSIWGPEKAEAFFMALKKNANIVSGNKQVALDVANRRLAFGLTDTDDAMIEQERGQKVEIIFPNQGAGDMGALLIPNTVAVIKGSGDNPRAQALIDFLLSPAVEKQLAEGRSAQFPLSSQVEVKSRAAAGTDIRWMQVDFAEAATDWERAAKFLHEKVVTPDK